jgi:hypothetical protein
MRREARTAWLLPEPRDLPSPKPIAEFVRQQREPMKKLALLLLLLFGDCKRAMPPGRVVLVPIGPLPPADYSGVHYCDNEHVRRRNETNRTLQ